MAYRIDNHAACFFQLSLILMSVGDQNTTAAGTMGNLTVVYTVTDKDHFPRIQTAFLYKALCQLCLGCRMDIIQTAYLLKILFNIIIIQLLMQDWRGADPPA